MSTDKDLGSLIRMLNPYGDAMDLYFGQSPSVDNIQVEVQSAYPASWEFKEEQQKINRAARIKYRFPVKNKDNEILYWVTDYLLIGFEGSGGA